jgi:hypothetical protein
MKREWKYAKCLSACLSAAMAMLLIAGSASAAQTPSPLAKPAPTWQTPSGGQVKTEALAWFDAKLKESKKPDAKLRAKADALWASLPATPSEDDLLIRLARTFALVDANAAKLVTMCSEPRGQLIVPSQPWLRDPKSPPLFTNNLRLLFARWLIEASLFDEASEQLSDLTPRDVVAPASLLFHQSVVYHALLNKESGLKSIDVLLQGADATPRRYVALAQLMQADLMDLQEDTLDHIARRMEDIRRRLDLGRAGPKVRTVEDGVIKTLDKLIKDLEDKQNQCNNGGGGAQSRSPMQNSQPAGGKGPGIVERKNIGSESGWGDLPPKEREEAMQQIGREYPAHYSEAIKEYFRRLAAEKND